MPCVGVWVSACYFQTVLVYNFEGDRNTRVGHLWLHLLITENVVEAWAQEFPAAPKMIASISLLC